MQCPCVLLKFQRCLYTFLLQFYHFLFEFKNSKMIICIPSFHNSVLVVSASSFQISQKFFSISECIRFCLWVRTMKLPVSKNVPLFHTFPFSLQISNDPFLRTLCEMHHNHFPGSQFCPLLMPSFCFLQFFFQFPDQLEFLQIVCYVSFFFLQMILSISLQSVLLNMPVRNIPSIPTQCVVPSEYIHTVSFQVPPGFLHSALHLFVKTPASDQISCITSP